MSLQNDVLAGFGLFARLHAVLHVNENVLTFEGGGVIDLDVLRIGTEYGFDILDGLDVSN